MAKDGAFYRALELFGDRSDISLSREGATLSGNPLSARAINMVGERQHRSNPAGREAINELLRAVAKGKTKATA